MSIDVGEKERRDLPVPMEIEVIQKSNPDSEIFARTEGATERRDAAALLLAVAAIASKEIRVDGLAWDDDMEEPTLVHPKANLPPRFSTTKWRRSTLTPRFADHITNFESDDDDMEDFTLPPVDDRFAWNRIRAVSMDSEGIRGSPVSSRKGISNIVSPESSPVATKRTPRKRRTTKRKRSYSVESVESGPEKRTLPNDRHRDKAMKVILRKKFSWKNYPEVCCLVFLAA